MRAILIDWLIEVHQKFRLRSETLFVTVNLIDRYASKQHIAKSELQLVGVSCMLVASKYEEIYPPVLRDFVQICNKSFSAPQILGMEQKVLFALDFDVKSHSPLRFLERYAKHAELGEEAFFFAQYLLEIALLDYRTLKHLPSTHASAAIYISQKLFKNPDPWPQKLVQESAHSKEKIKPCAFEMCNLLHKIEKSNVQAVFKKFQTAKYKSVAKLTS
jgi:transcription initiation factor TFIIIB Brf1 subunit/transcription initiation factor TFIIB